MVTRIACLGLATLLLTSSAGAMQLITDQEAQRSPVLTSRAVREPGTSRALAELRSKQISNLSYQVQFSIPDSSKAPIVGSERIVFDLKEASRSVILDFKGGRLKSLSVNSRALDLAVVRGHIEIPPSALSKGQNVIDVTFVAGELGFRRRDDFLYTLFVPDNASKSFPCFDQPDFNILSVFRRKGEPQGLRGNPCGLT